VKYWAYMNGEVPGSYEPAALAALPGFTMTTLVCPGEGEIEEKNWRRAGEFEDIARAVEAHRSAAPPPAPLGAPPTSNEVDALLDTASTRLFSHVADLMKELETRRDEKSLIVSLQRQISTYKNELARMRETTATLEIRIPRIAELEEALRKDRASLAQLQEQLPAREGQLNEMRMTFERMRGDLDGAKRRAQESENDLGIRNRLVDKLSHDLSEKELSLAKALGVIRRLEEDLNRLCPSPELQRPASAVPPVAPVRQAPPPPPPSAPEIVEPIVNRVLSVPEFKTPMPAPITATFTNDDPPLAPAYLEPQHTIETPKAQQALMSFLRKVFPGQSN
jgi:hypothetical protein